VRPDKRPQNARLAQPQSNNQRPSPRKSPAECFAEARRNNQVAIELDTAGLGLSLVPGANLAVAGTGLAVGTASLINSGVHGDLTAIGIGAVGYHIGAVAPAAEQFGKVAAEAIPLAGTIVAAGALGWDLYSANQEYQKCLADNYSWTIN